MIDDTIEQVASEVLRLTVASHQRSRCNAHGARSTAAIACDCKSHWNPARHWCDNCGRTLGDLIESEAI